eukprot:gene5023-5514_t
METLALEEDFLDVFSDDLLDKDLDEALSYWDEITVDDVDDHRLDGQTKPSEQLLATIESTPPNNPYYVSSDNAVVISNPTVDNNPHQSFANTAQPHPSFVSSSSSTTNRSSGGHSSSKRSRVTRTTRKARQPFFREMRQGNGEVVMINTKPLGFPSFSKTNFLLYLPTVISKCMNSGDFKKMKDIFLQRAHPDCVVMVPYREAGLLGADYITRFYQSIQAYHPDALCCVTSITATNAEIKSAFAFKGTMISNLHEHIKITEDGKLIEPEFRSSRERIFQMMEKNGKSPQEIESMRELIMSTTNLNLTGNGCIKLILDSDKAIERFEITYTLTSAEPVIEEEE